MAKSKRNKNSHHAYCKQDLLTSKIFNTLLVNNLKEKWFEIEVDIQDSANDSPPDSDLVSSLSQEAENLLLQDVSVYNDRRARDRRSDHQWMQTVMSKGTSADKIAAHTVQVQDSPVHSLAILRNLVGMVRVGKKKECIAAMETLCELWISDLLHPDKKLRPFSTRPLARLTELDNVLARNKCLAMWWFEDNLKEIYKSFVQALDALAREAVDTGREKAISSMCQLLTENPEQEQLLLRQVVNKLGDPQQKVASKTIYCLNKVLEKHPNMQPVVLSEVEKMLFRPNIGHKAQYYAICFLTQFRLQADQHQLSVNLIRVYFCFFRACIKKGELDSRMLSVLLMGVNRAFPYAQNTLGDELSQHLDTMHRVVHLSPFNVALHALCLLYQVAEASSAVGDRFYCAMYKKLLDPQLLTSSHHAAFLNLLYKSLNSDAEILRVKAFIKRILQVCAYAPVPLACGMLYMVSQVLNRKKGLQAVQLEPSSFKSEPELDEDEEEKYTDAKLESDQDSDQEEEVKAIPTSSWIHRPNSQQKDKNVCKKGSKYDPMQRNPLFCCADQSVYTELSVLARHHHPSVALFADNILNGTTIDYTGDPLQDFTTSRFLDRFVFKNPKKMEKGVSRNSQFSRRKEYRPGGMKSLSVTSKSYVNELEQRVPCEEVFLHRYLQKKVQPWLKSEKDNEEDNSDADSVASDEFEQLLTRGTLGGSTADEQPNFADDLGGEFSGAEHSDSSSEEDEDSGARSKKSKKMKKMSKKRQYSDDEDDDGPDLPDAFASAEEFAGMLEDTGASGQDVGGSSLMDNRDNADVKQLNWEAARDRWVKRSDNIGSKRKTKFGRPTKKRRKN